MSSGEDWFPKNRNDILAMAKRWEEVLSECDEGTTPNMVAWGITVATVQEMGTIRLDCLPYQEMDNLGQLTADRREAYNGLLSEIEAVMRKLHYEFYKPGFLPANQVRLGLKPHGQGGGAGTADDRQLSLSLDTLPSNHEVRGDVRRLHSKSKSKGPYHAAEFRTWKRALDEPAPANADEPGWESYAYTATPWHMVFNTAADIGKRLYVTGRWEKNVVSGEKGKEPWSPMQSIIIP
jgi:hypothetical protein